LLILRPIFVLLFITTNNKMIINVKESII
jgi:hypothetical protein